MSCVSRLTVNKPLIRVFIQSHFRYVKKVNNPNYVISGHFYVISVVKLYKKCWLKSEKGL